MRIDNYYNLYIDHMPDHLRIKVKKYFIKYITMGILDINSH